MDEEDKQEMREFAEQVEADEPVGGEFKVVAEPAFKDSVVVVDGVEGKYRAHRIKDKVEEEFGHIGVTFSVRSD